MFTSWGVRDAMALFLSDSTTAIILSVLCWIDELVARGGGCGVD